MMYRVFRDSKTCPICYKFMIGMYQGGRIYKLWLCQAKDHYVMIKNDNSFSIMIDKFCIVEDFKLKKYNCGIINKTTMHAPITSNLSLEDDLDDNTDIIAILKKFIKNKAFI